MHLTLLPGMDGTGRLFRRFVDVLPDDVSTDAVVLPQSGRQSYEALAGAVLPHLAAGPRTLLVGESFSGPLALRLAARSPQHVSGVVLVATFVEPPRFARIAAWVARIWDRQPSAKALCWALTGGDTELAADVEDALLDASHEVLAARLHAIATVDAWAELNDCPVPVLALNASRDRVLRGRGGLDDVDPAPGGDDAVRTIDAPHLLLQSRPEAAWEAIAAWWSDVSGAGGGSP